MGYQHRDRLSWITLLLGGILGASAVSMGAWGTHGLTEVLDSQAHRSFMVAVRYQLIHSVLIVSLATAGVSGRLSRWALLLMVIGVTLFSGSIYGLVLLDGVSWLGPVTPFGGFFIIVSWLLIAIRAGRHLLSQTGDSSR